MAYNEEYSDRKNFLSHELVLFVVLRWHKINCKISDFNRLKKCHIRMCMKVLERLNWDNYFLPYNKQTMEQIQSYINEFFDNIKSLVTEECQIDIELVKTRLQDLIVPQDTCDRRVYKCIYVIKKGDKRGQKCGERSKSNYCAKHAHHMFKESDDC